MIHHRNVIAEAFERAVESAQGRVGLLDFFGLAVTLYLTVCVYQYVARPTPADDTFNFYAEEAAR